MSRMYKSVTRTWNPFTGCYYFCYGGGCWARRTAARLRHLRRYKDGFMARFNEEELLKTFSPGQFVAVSLMGDIAWATREQALRILTRIGQFPKTFFLIQTKNPRVFWDWRVTFPPHVYLGTTIETNRGYRLSQAPPPAERLHYLVGYPHSLKFLSIEPIADFDVDELVGWVEALKPAIIEVGVDNYRNKLPEPPWEKVERLLGAVRGICPVVREKEGLQRLKGVGQ